MASSNDTRCQRSAPAAPTRSPVQTAAAGPDSPSPATRRSRSQWSQAWRIASTPRLHSASPAPPRRGTSRPGRNASNSPARPGIEIEAAGLAQHIAGRRLVGDETVHVDIGIGISDINARRIAMARQPFATPQIDTALKAQQLAGGARIGERPVAVVDLLAEDPAPDRGPPAGVQAIGRCFHRRLARQSRPACRRRLGMAFPYLGQRCIADALMQVPSVVIPNCRAIG